MCYDVPVTIYPKSKESKGKGKNKLRTDFTSPSAEKIERAANLWKEKYGGKDTSIKINDYL